MGRRADLLVVALVLAFATGCDMRQLVYPAPLVAVGDPPPGLTEVRWRPPGGGEVHGWVHRADEAAGPRPVLVFFHGNGENLETMRLAGLFDDLLRLRVHLVATDYPGYGRSDGSPSEARVLAAADEALDRAAATFPARPLVAAGWSLGAAVAVQLAGRHPERVAALVALSPWTRLEEVAAAHFPSWLVRMVLREGYDSLAAAPGVTCPALVVVGGADGIIPPAQGRHLAAALGARARLVELPNVGHNDLPGRPEVWHQVGRFLDEVAGGREPG